MRTLHSIGLALALLAGPPGFAAQPRVSLQTYANPDFRYVISYPSNWQFKLPDDEGTIFVTSYLDSPVDRLRENVNLRVQRSDQPDFNVRDNTPEMLAQVSRVYPSFKQVGLGYVQWNGVEALRYDGTITTPINGKPFDMHILQNIAIKNGVIYTATYTAEAGSYAKYLPTALRIIESIKVK